MLLLVKICGHCGKLDLVLPQMYSKAITKGRKD